MSSYNNNTNNNNNEDETSSNINLTLLALKKLPQFSQVDTSEMYEENSGSHNINEGNITSESKDNSPVRNAIDQSPLVNSGSINNQLDVIKIIDSVNGKLDTMGRSPVAPGNNYSTHSNYASAANSNIDFNINSKNSHRQHANNMTAQGYIHDSSPSFNLNPTVYNSDIEDDEDNSVMNNTTRFASLTQELANKRGRGINSTAVDLIPTNNNTTVLINNSTATSNINNGFSLSSSAALNSDISHFNLNSTTDSNKSKQVFSSNNKNNNTSTASNNNTGSRIEEGEEYMGYIDSTRIVNPSTSSNKNDKLVSGNSIYDDDDDDNSSLNLSQYNRYKFTNNPRDPHSDANYNSNNNGGKTFSSLESFSGSSKDVAATKETKISESGDKKASKASHLQYADNDDNVSSNELRVRCTYDDSNNSNCKSMIQSHEIIYANSSSSHSNSSNKTNVNVVNAVNGIAAVRLSGTNMQIQNNNGSNHSSASGREIYNYSPSVNNQKTNDNDGDTYVVDTSTVVNSKNDKEFNAGGLGIVHSEINDYSVDKHGHNNRSNQHHHRHHSRQQHSHSNHNKKESNGNIPYHNGSGTTRRVSSLVNASSNFLSQTGDDNIVTNGSILSSRRKSRNSKPGVTSRHDSSSTSRGRSKRNESIDNEDTDSSYSSASNISDSGESANEEEDADDYEGISRPLYIPAVIRKTEEKISVKRYHMTQQQKKKQVFLNIQTTAKSSSSNNRSNISHETNRHSFTSPYIVSPTVSLHSSSPLQGKTVSISTNAGVASHGTSSPHSSNAHHINTIKHESSSSVSSLQNVILNNNAKVDNKGCNSNLESSVHSDVGDVNNNDSVSLSGEISSSKISSNAGSIAGYVSSRPVKAFSDDSHEETTDNESNHSSIHITSASSNNGQQQPYGSLTSPRSSNSSSIMIMRANYPNNWKADNSVSKCPVCGKEFGLFFRRHHCRKCGDIFCDHCSKYRIVLDSWGNFRNVDKFVENISYNGNYHYNYNCNSNGDYSIKEVRSCEKCYKFYREFLRGLTLARMKDKDIRKKSEKINDDIDESTSSINGSISRRGRKDGMQPNEVNDEPKKRNKERADEDEEEENYEVYENNWSTF